jgi:hypothetical protein
MQNRYVADIGDYLKFAILRTLTPGRHLGVLWWLFPNENHNKDGGHREYLDRTDEWRRFDPELFDALARINRERNYSVRAIENSAILKNAVFVSDAVPCDCLPYSERPQKRTQWLRRAEETVTDCDLLFLDPDNGIASEKMRLTCRSTGKSATIEELKSLQRHDRAIVVYHHQTRFKGGHTKGVDRLKARLANHGFRISCVLRAKPWSPRLFFVLDGNDELQGRVEHIAKCWKPWITLA